MNEDFDLMRMAGWGNQSYAPQGQDWLSQLTQPAQGTSLIPQGNSLLDGFLGKNGQQGWGNLALGAAQGIGGAYMGMKQYGLAKDALAQSQDQFNKNYGAQRQTLNTQLEDRQRARVAASAGQAESVADYMARNRLY